MAELTNTRANADSAQTPQTAGTLHSFIGPRGVKCFRIMIINGSSEAVDITGEVGPGLNTVALLLQEIEVLASVLVYQLENDATGQISVMTEGTDSWAAAAMQTAIRAMGTTVGPNSIDVSLSTVVDNGFELSA
jgi:hypothetical protein